MAGTWGAAVAFILGVAGGVLVAALYANVQRLHRYRSSGPGGDASGLPRGDASSLAGVDESLGQSKQQALDSAATFGNLFSQLGIGSGAERPPPPPPPPLRP